MASSGLVEQPSSTALQSSAPTSSLSSIDDEVLVREEAAEFLKICPAFLRQITTPLGPPPCVRYAKKAVR